jgi:hypothetical protein
MFLGYRILPVGVVIPREVDDVSATIELGGSSDSHLAETLARRPLTADHRLPQRKTQTNYVFGQPAAVKRRRNLVQSRQYTLSKRQLFLRRRQQFRGRDQRAAQRTEKGF